jgi:hypothetical protein
MLPCAPLQDLDSPVFRSRRPDIDNVTINPKYGRMTLAARHILVACHGPSIIARRFPCTLPRSAIGRA